MTRRIAATQLWSSAGGEEQTECTLRGTWPLVTDEQYPSCKVALSTNIIPAALDCEALFVLCILLLTNYFLQLTPQPLYCCNIQPNIIFLVSHLMSKVYQHLNKFKIHLDATEVFITDLIALLNMFRATLCPSSGAQEYYTVVLTVHRR